MIKVKLAQRIEIDCEAFDKLCSEMEPTPENNIKLKAVLIAQSIRAAALCEWYEPHKWLRYFWYKKYTPKYILKHWGRKDMQDAYETIFVLEGGDLEALKKKMKEAEEKLEGLLAGDLQQKLLQALSHNSQLKESKDSQSENTLNGTQTPLESE